MKTIDFPNDCEQDSSRKGKGCVNLGSDFELYLPTVGGRIEHDKDDALEHPLPRGYFGVLSKIKSSKVIRATGTITFTFHADGETMPYHYALEIDSTGNCIETQRRHHEPKSV